MRRASPSQHRRLEHRQHPADAGHRPRDRAHRGASPRAAARRRRGARRRRRLRGARLRLAARPGGRRGLRGGPRALHLDRLPPGRRARPRPPRPATALSTTRRSPPRASTTRSRRTRRSGEGASCGRCCSRSRASSWWSPAAGPGGGRDRAPPAPSASPNRDRPHGVAVGTSLPSSSLRRRGAAAPGGRRLRNIIGSNIYNVLGIGGVTGLVAPVTSHRDRHLRPPVMVGVTALMLVFAYTARKDSRAGSAVLRAGYGVYLWFLWPA